jgi:hypothetical protein
MARFWAAFETARAAAFDRDRFVKSPAREPGFGLAFALPLRRPDGGEIGLAFAESSANLKHKPRFSIR